MHIADGVLSEPVLAATGAIAAAGMAVGLRKLDYERVPRAGVLAAAFFVVSLIHLPLGPAPVAAHPTMIGLMGLMLGWAAFPALAAALLLQAVQFGHGGLVALGANVCAMGCAAVACHYLFRSWVRAGRDAGVVCAAAFLAGVCGTLLAGLATSLALYASGREFAAVRFLRTVRPEFLHAPLLERLGPEENRA